LVLNKCHLVLPPFFLWERPRPSPGQASAAILQAIHEALHPRIVAAFPVDPAARLALQETLVILAGFWLQPIDHALFVDGFK
jgi:hypothetical protein